MIGPGRRNSESGRDGHSGMELSVLQGMAGQMPPARLGIVRFGKGRKRMRKMRRYRNTALSALCLAFVLFAMVGCGASSKDVSQSTNEFAAADSAAVAESGGGIYEMKAVETPEEEAALEEDGQTVNDQRRKLIKTVDMDVETKNFDALIAHVEKQVEALGGYVESSDVYNGSYTSDYRSRNARITARIPAERLDDFVADVAEQSNITSKNESVEDVTLQYVDLESHKRALQTEQESLLSMLENAETIEDILAINSQLTDVRYQLDSMESQLRTYDNKINYSTVHLYVDEVEQYVPYVAQTPWERISQGFTENLYKVGNGIANFFIELIIALPIIAVAAVIIGAVIAILFVTIRRSEKKARERREKQGTPSAGTLNGVPYDRYRSGQPGRGGRPGRNGAPENRADQPGGTGAPENRAGQPGGAGVPENRAGQSGGTGVPENRAGQPGGTGASENQAGQPGGAGASENRAGQPGGAGVPENRAGQPGGAENRTEQQDGERP